MTRRLRGIVLVDLLAAALLIALSSVATVVGIHLAVRSVVDKRVTEMGTFLAMREMDRLKAIRYMQLIDTGAKGLTGSAKRTCFDKYGTKKPHPVPQGYIVSSYVWAIVSRDNNGAAGNLREIEVDVQDSDMTTTYDVEATVLSCGGL